MVNVWRVWVGRETIVIKKKPSFIKALVLAFAHPIKFGLSSVTRFAQVLKD
jgi:hypothetical protein